jgi:hypothetical protein
MGSSCAAPPASLVAPAPPPRLGVDVGPSAPSVHAAVDPDAGRAPTPFTAAALRAATTAGQTWLYLVEGPSSLPAQRRVRVFAADEEHVSVVAEQLDDEGRPIGPPETVTRTWDAYRRESSFEAGSTTVDATTAETPAGSFRAKRYRVVTREGASTVTTTYYFAEELPGFPVETVVERDGTLERSTILLSFAPPRP